MFVERLPAARTDELEGHRAVEGYPFHLRTPTARTRYSAVGLRVPREAPKPGGGAARPRVPDTDWRILQPDEVRRVAKAFKDEQARTIFLMLAVTGLRKSGGAGTPLA
jgi:integrase